MAQKGQFVYFDESQKRHIKSIIGFRIDIDDAPKFLWICDADKLSAFPDDEEEKESISFRHLTEIFTPFAIHVEFEYYFGEVGDTFFTLMRDRSIIEEHRI